MIVFRVNGHGMEKSWEWDFMRELFDAPYFRHVAESAVPGVAVCSHQGHVGPIEEILNKNKLRRNRIRILVHLSDEFMGLDRNAYACAKLYAKIPLILRQYVFSSQAAYKHLLQIPLAYISNYLTGNATSSARYSSSDYALWSLSRPSHQRYLQWSFVGRTHGDRQHAISKFSSWSPHVVSNSSTPAEMKRIYDQSKFVIVGHGHHTCDAMRIYEAIIAGAMPVVVASKEMIAYVFLYNGRKPPLLHAHTWGEALQICQNMTDFELDQRRAALVGWYVSTMQLLSRRILGMFNLSNKATVPSAGKLLTYKIQETAV